LTTIVYLHGFRSSPASIKATHLRGYVAALPGAKKLRLHIPELAHRPAAAVAEVAAWVEREAGPEALTFIGSSLGGYYATYLAERLDCLAVLINPAVTPHVGLEAYLGTQKNLHTGEPYELTRAHLEGWRRLLVERIDPERYLLLLETGDEVLDWRAAARKYEGARAAIRDGGDHSLQGFADHIPRILTFAGIRT